MGNSDQPAGQPERSAVLTAKRRVISQIQHLETDRVPYTIGYSEGIARRLDTYYGCVEWRNLIDEDIRRAPGPRLLPAEAVEHYVDPYGTVWRTDQRPWHVVRPPLDSPSLEGYVFFGY